jgi:iron complex transport system permease protein
VTLALSPSPRRARTALVLGASLLLLLFGALVQLYAPDRLGHDGTEASLEVQSFVFYQLRLPRFLIAVIVGSTLSLVGAAFQTLFRNPLATPSTVGTTAGAALGALAALALGLRGVGVLPAATLFAFLGALGASSLVLSVAKNARARVEEILLAGIAVTLGAGALSQGLHVISDAGTLFASAQWSLGQLPQVGYDRLLLLSVPAAICATSILSQSRALSTLSLGEAWAQSLGVETNRVRFIVLVGGCLGVGASVALCGPIAFVGLLVPHLVRLGLGGEHRPLLPLSFVAGGAFLVFCDAITKTLPLDQELPVGVLTASLGAPALFLLILRRPHARG